MIELLSNIAGILGGIAVVASFLVWLHRRITQSRTVDVPKAGITANGPDREFSELPASVQDPGIQEAVRLFYIRTFGRAPTRHEMFNQLNQMLIDDRTTHLVYDEVKELEAEQRAAGEHGTDACGR